MTSRRAGPGWAQIPDLEYEGLDGPQTDLVGTAQPTRFGPNTHHRLPSVTTLRLKVAEWPPRARVRLRPNQAQKPPKTVPNPLEFHAHGVPCARDVRMAQFGLWGAQPEALGGPYGAVWGRLANPHNHLGLTWAQKHDPAVSWGTWLQPQPRGHFSRIHAPIAGGCHSPK